MSSGPRDPRQRAVWRRERALVARRLHPDRGGDADALIEALAEVDARYAAPLVTSPAGAWVGMRRTVTRQMRRSQRGLRALRGRLPRRLPGARRYIDL